MRWLIMIGLLGLLVSTADAQRDEPLMEFGQGLPASIFWNSDGTSFFVHTHSNTLWHYSAETMTAIAMLEDVIHAALSPDGKWLLTRNADDVRTLRRAEDIEQVVVDNLRGSYFSGDGRWLVNFGDNGVAIWSLDDTPEIALDNLHAVIFNAQGTRMLIRQDDRYTLWDGRTLIPEGNQPDFADDIIHFQWSDDGEQIAGLTDGDRVYVYNFADPTLNHSLILPDRRRYDRLQWSPDSTRFLNFDYAGNARVWDISTGELVVDIPSGETYLTPEELAETFRMGPSIWVLNWSTDSSHIFRCHSGGDLSTRCGVYDAETGELMRWAGGGGMTWGVEFSPDRRYFAFSDGLFDANTGIVVDDFGRGGRGGEYRAWSPDNRRVALSSWRYPTIYIYDVDQLRMQHTLDVPPFYYGLDNLVWSPDNRHLLIWGGSGFITLWDGDTGLEVGRLTEHIRFGEKIAFSSDSSLVAATDVLGNVAVFDTASGELLHVLSGHAERIERFEWQPGGTLIATNDARYIVGFPAQDAPDQNVVQIWNAASGELFATLQFSTRVTAVTWHPSGSWLLIEDVQGIYLWDVATRIRRQLDEVRGVTPLPRYHWSEDGRMMIRRYRSCSHGGPAYDVYDTTTFQLISSPNCTGYDLPIWVSVFDQFAWTSDQCDTSPATGERCEVEVFLYESIPIDQNGHFAPRLEEPDHHFGTFTTIESIEWSPDYTSLLVLGDGHAEIWTISLETAERQHVFQNVTSGIWSPDSQRLALLDSEGVHVVDAATEEVLLSIDGGQAPAWMNRYLQVCRGDPCIQELWDVDEGRVLVSGDQVPTVISPDGRFGAEANTGTFRLWSLSD